MQNTSILDVNSIAYTYRIDVTAQYGAKPYTAIISYFYISYNSCIICEEAVFSDFGSKAKELNQKIAHNYLMYSQWYKE